MGGNNCIGSEENIESLDVLMASRIRRRKLYEPRLCAQRALTRLWAAKFSS